MSLANNNIAIKGVAEGQWVVAVRDANLPIRANGKYGDFVGLMKRYADLSLGLADDQSFSLEYLRQFFQTTADSTYAVLSTKFVSCISLVYPIIARRTLGCAYGGRCKFGKCVFCLPLPNQACSYPVDFVSLCTVFWDLKPSPQFSVGIGAMLAAAHVRGHSCITSLYANRVGRTAPHGIVSFEHLRLAVGVDAFDEFDDGSAILKVSVTSKGAGDSVHYLSCGFLPPGPLPEVTVHSAKTTLMFEVLPLSVLSSSKSVQSLPLVDEGLGLVPPDFCKFSCGNLEPGKGFCRVCGFVVKLDGHESRCSHAVPSVYSKTQARLGDVMHRFDVIVGLSARGIHGADQTRLIADMVSAKAQMAFMVDKGYAGSGEPQATVSTRFEHDYLSLRKCYLAYAFPAVSAAVFAYSFPNIKWSTHSLLKSDPVVLSDKSSSLDEFSALNLESSRYDAAAFVSSVSGSESSSYEDAVEPAMTGKETSADVERDRVKLRGKIAELEALSELKEEDKAFLLLYKNELKRLGRVFRALKVAESAVSD